MLLVEQNANVALSIAALRLHHGERPDRPRGEAEKRRTRTCASSTWAAARERRATRRSSRTGGARGGCREAREHPRSLRLEQETAADASAASRSRLLETVAHARAHSTHFRRTRARRRGRARADPHPAQGRLPALQAAESALRRPDRVEASRLARMFASPGPILRAAGRRRRLLALPPGVRRRGVPPGDVVMNSSSYHLTPLRVHARFRRAQPRLRGGSGGTGQTDLQAASRRRCARPDTWGRRASSTRCSSAGASWGRRSDSRWPSSLPRCCRSRCGRSWRATSRSASCRATARPTWGSCPTSAAKRTECTCTPSASSRSWISSRPARRRRRASPGRLSAPSSTTTYPLLRFATGDIGTMAEPAKCACGRTAPKLAGLLGRVGDAVKVKGMFIRGAEIEKALKAFPAVSRFQAVITRDQHQDHLEYVLDLAPGAAVDVALVADALRDAVKVRGEVRTGAVAQNAQRIDDRRVWEMIGPLVFDQAGSGRRCCWCTGFPPPAGSGRGWSRGSCRGVSARSSRIRRLRRLARRLRLGMEKQAHLASRAARRARLDGGRDGRA